MASKTERSWSLNRSAVAGKVRSGGPNRGRKGCRRCARGRTLGRGTRRSGRGTFLPRWSISSAKRAPATPRRGRLKRGDQGPQMRPVVPCGRHADSGGSLGHAARESVDRLLMHWTGRPRPHQGHALEPAVELRQMFASVYPSQRGRGCAKLAAHLLGGIRLGIEGLQVAWDSWTKNQDDVSNRPATGVETHGPWLALDQAGQTDAVPGQGSRRVRVRSMKNGLTMTKGSRLS